MAQNVCCTPLLVIRTAWLMRYLLPSRLSQIHHAKPEPFVPRERQEDQPQAIPVDPPQPPTQLPRAFQMACACARYHSDATHFVIVLACCSYFTPPLLQRDWNYLAPSISDRPWKNKLTNLCQISREIIVPSKPMLHLANN